jgi:hypothetical protein
MWDNSVLGFTGKLICLRMEDCLQLHHMNGILLNSKGFREKAVN